MNKQIFNLLISLLKEPKWRSELPRVCPECCGVKMPDEYICGNCVDVAMARLRPDSQHESYQVDGFSIGRNCLQLGRWCSYTHTDGEIKNYWRETG